MRRVIGHAVLFFASALLCAHAQERNPLEDLRARYTDQAFLKGEAFLSASAAAGRELWYKATAGNAAFHADVLPTIDARIDWLRVLRSDKRAQRFTRWGLINDPSCCTPGTVDCPARDAAQTYGFDWCAGDEDLLTYVGRSGYVDPACRFREAGGDAESRCLLAFGTSAGAIGLRKFPNPRFDAQAWESARRGTVHGWDGGYPARPLRSRAEVEPPFLIGLSCAACHAGFDPPSPPRDPAQPNWDNVRATVGNQYLRIGEIFASGLPRSSVHAQLLAFGRPGTQDTSFIEDDGIANPSSINAIINLAQRPRPGGELNLMKGGEDSTGLLDSMRRVYLSMGVCARECLLDHLKPQRPVDVEQCKRDCAEFRALDQRLQAIADFLYSPDAAPTDLRAAREAVRRRIDPQAQYTQAELVRDLEREFGRRAPQRGRVLFAQHCARCHSSQAVAERDFLHPAGGERMDWLGNDEPTQARTLGVNACRALHTNHLRGQVWAPFANDTYQARGPGYYRNVSLLSVWAHAPLLHNNALGPELCQRPVRGEGCAAFNPGVEARFRLYVAAMQQLLSARRTPKVTRLRADAILKITRAPNEGRALELVVPAGTPVAIFGSFDAERYARDRLQAASVRHTQRARLTQRAMRPYLRCKDVIENAGHHYGTDLSARDKRALIAYVATL